MPLPPAESTWLNDYKKAQQEAKASNKFLLLDFTGSDWCGWCKRLEQEILSQSQFENYARENLVLLEVDFPRAKPQSPELRKQNQELAQQYQVEGFPTIVVLNGVKVTDYKDGDPVPERKFDFEPQRGPRPDFGYFGLQNHSDNDIVFFKEVAIKPLKK